MFRPMGAGLMLGAWGWGDTGVGAMVALNGELQPVIDIARRRMQKLQAEVGAGCDKTGRKSRELQRLRLYTCVVKRLKRSDALMPEVILANERGRFAVSKGKK